MKAQRSAAEHGSRLSVLGAMCVTRRWSSVHGRSRDKVTYREWPIPSIGALVATRPALLNLAMVKLGVRSSPAKS
jgi:hypothetical protein